MQKSFTILAKPFGTWLHVKKFSKTFQRLKLFYFGLKRRYM